MSTSTSEQIGAITIRPGHPDDESAIHRLAALDSAPVPSGPFLLAEVDGELRAALSLRSGRAISDPFRLTLGILAVLRAYAAAGEPESHGRRSTYRAGRLALGY